MSQQHRQNPLLQPPNRFISPTNPLRGGGEQAGSGRAQRAPAPDNEGGTATTARATPHPEGLSPALPMPPLPLPAPQGTFPTPPGALPPSPPEMSPCSPSQHTTTTLYPLLAPSPAHLAAPPPKPHPATTSELLSRGVSPLPPIPSTPSRPCASPCPASRFPRSVRQTHPRRCTPLPTGRPRRRAAASPHWGDSSR